MTLSFGPVRFSRAQSATWAWAANRMTCWPADSSCSRL